ncbi:nuclear transport factor 2 family protein [Mameliella alba]|nr:nuclear transport factor 2 family protein [Antarctobacter heliothermus]MBY6145442.1 nuclear transport factor 2 family protein [Mameliella alba]MCA0955190.1 nuclear transport factor 2 family protein [Mameliella alba]
MTRPVLAALGLALVTALPAGADEAADITAIEAIWDSYETARVSGDAEGWLALWDAEGIQMPPGVPARGFDALKVGVPKGFAAKPATAMQILPVETVVMGDWAFSRGTYTATIAGQAGPVEVDGKFMTIFRRQDDGGWRIYRDIFNSNR